MTVEGHEFADELTAVLDCDPHSVVDVLEHLRTLRHRHFRKNGDFCLSGILSFREQRGRVLSNWST